MKFDSIMTLGKPALLLALVAGFVGSTLNLPSEARYWRGEGLGRHSGFYGRGGVGPGGYHFGDRFEDNHPRRSEVLSRDNRLNWDINKDRGHLGGNYGSLEAQQRSIRQQEQADARANGGYITRSQQRQINGEENSLHQQVNQDYTRR